MRTAVVALLAVAAAFAVAVAPAGGGAHGGVCEEMTPQRLLDGNPRFAKEWSDALRSGDSAAVARMAEILSRLRELHGCDGRAGHGAPDPRHALPPGHPPVDRGEPAMPGGLFEEPSTLAI